MQVTAKQKTENLEAMSQTLASEKRSFSHYNLIRMSLTIIAADLFGLLLAGLCAVTIRYVIRLFIGGGFSFFQYINFIPIIILFLIPYALQGLYPGVGNTFVDELRKLSLSTSLMVALITVVFYFGKIGTIYSRLTLVLFWAFALLLVPVSRWVIRGLFISHGDWGEPVVVVGSGDRTRRMIAFLSQNKHLGFLPVAMVQDGNIGVQSLSGKLLAIPASDIEKDPNLLRGLHISTAILIPTETPEPFLQHILEDRQFGLKKVILVSRLPWVGGPAVIVRDLDGIPGLEQQRNLLGPIDQMVKLLLTTLILLATSWIIIPLIALCALAIRLDSKGPIFYSHKRIGRDGKEIKVWKFRTMWPNADEVLRHYLETSPGLQEEWDANHKLKNDPRVTRVGKFLRKTSLDELPQLWNVIKREMDLVGPRPIVQEEVEKYKTSFRLYTQVRPGMTGLWQTSGRNDLSYDERISLDEYYVRHWSVWMDTYILLRTIQAVLFRNGAY